MKNKVIVILGPTGVGKTRLSIELAKKFNGEIINADSMQVYKGLNIGTAKVTEEEKEGIPHHLFDICELNEDYNVYLYQKHARLKIKEIFNKNKTPILVGGTGLYIKAALYNYNFIKEDFVNYDHLTNKEIYTKIQNKNIHINNRQRLLRQFQKEQNDVENNKANELLYDAIFVGLTTPRDNLYKIIDNRVDKMINNGLIEEVEALYNKNIKTRSINTAIGYKELYKYFDQTLSLNESIELIQKNSRNYAKRQYTFFNNQLPVIWFDVNYNHFEETVNAIINIIKE
ncbi:MAG: tRNA (adenosine(37)-N6)-dimethylallyltransferase MiaA [Tenericutes bacterium]|jgi:tRNA dimethylallyltransferase|nr:tRNA (adenosine(37)-N6)-dimethylallyltransferase MiaA [Mycoplasmatota bacterium]